MDETNHMEKYWERYLQVLLRNTSFSFEILSSVSDHGHRRSFVDESSKLLTGRLKRGWNSKRPTDSLLLFRLCYLFIFPVYII